MNNRSLKLIYTDSSASGRFLAGFFLKKFSFLISQCMEAETPAEMFQLASDFRADAVLINYKGIPLSVASAIRQLRASVPDVKIVVMNFDHSEFEKIELMKAGVNAIMPVETTLQNILLGLVEMRPDRFMSNYLMPESRLRKINDDGIDLQFILTMQEVECIKSLCYGRKAEQIAEQQSVPEKEVQKMILEIQEKTHCHTTLDFIRFALLNNILNVNEFTNEHPDGRMFANGS